MVQLVFEVKDLFGFWEAGVWRGAVKAKKSNRLIGMHPKTVGLGVFEYGPEKQGGTNRRKLRRRLHAYPQTTRAANNAGCRCLHFDSNPWTDGAAALCYLSGCRQAQAGETSAAVMLAGQAWAPLQIGCHNNRGIA